MTTQEDLRHACIEGVLPEDKRIQWLLYSHLSKLERLNYLYPGLNVRVSVPPGFEYGSGYRSPNYEERRGRSRRGVHCYGQESVFADVELDRHLGAVDVIADDYLMLRTVLIKENVWTRCCWYPNSRFVHLDMASHSHPWFIDRGTGWMRVTEKEFIVG